MDAAVGIHAHPTLKTGLIPTDPEKPILAIDPVLTGVTPPVSEDRYTGVTFALDRNDAFGTCGPTSVDNDRRSTSFVATGTQRSAPIEAVDALYRASGNPNFDPTDPNTEDNGVEMGSMLDALMQIGLDGDKPVAFGRAKAMTDEAIERLVAVFGGVLFAVTLDEAQQSQSNGADPRWTWHQSGVWGGHAIYNGKYKVTGPGNVDAPVISWLKEIHTTDSFRQHQLDEVWVVIWPWHLEHPAFLEGVDVQALAAAFKELTGKVLPVPPAPAPGPGPTPGPTPDPGPSPSPGGGISPDDADRKVWGVLQEWAVEDKHVGENREAATAVKTWATEKGLLV